MNVEIFEKSFFDCVNDYCNAEKIKDISIASKSLINYVNKRMPFVQCYIENGKLWIKPVDNASCSTSIISSLMNIKANNIDDSQWTNGIWSIHLYRR